MCYGWRYFSISKDTEPRMNVLKKIILENNHFKVLWNSIICIFFTIDLIFLVYLFSIQVSTLAHAIIFKLLHKETTHLGEWF